MLWNDDGPNGVLCSYQSNGPHTARLRALCVTFVVAPAVTAEFG
jgi:hypothetical protein